MNVTTNRAIDERAIELVLQDKHAVNLRQPQLVLQVENGWLSIDNNEGLVRHNSYENKGLSAFSRTVAMNNFSHTSVVTRHQGGTTREGVLPDSVFYIPVVVTKDNHLLPVTCPWRSFDDANKAAIALGELCNLPFKEMEKSVIAIRHEPTPGWLSRFGGRSFFDNYGKKAAFLLLTLAGGVTHSVVGLLYGLAGF